MTRDFYYASILLVFCIFTCIYLFRQVKRDWKDLTKRGHNIVFIIAIACGVLGAIVGAYRVILELTS